MVESDKASKKGKKEGLSWKKDPLREVLKQDIANGKISADMKPEQARKVRPEYEAMDKKLFSSRLSGMKKSLNKEPKAPKVKKWNKKNPVRYQLKMDMAKDIITDEMTLEEAFAVRASYQEMGIDLFKSRLAGMKEIVKKAKDCAAEDAMQFFIDRLLHRRPETNHRGKPLWVDHEAKLLLELDIDNNVHLKLTPEEMWNSR